MSSPKRMIPKLAVAALALTGCGETGSPNDLGGSGGSGGTSGTGGTLAGSLEAFGLKLIECFPGYYDSTQGCVSEIAAYGGLDGEISSECEAAVISYFQCGTPLTCQELDMPGANSCADEAAAANQACNRKDRSRALGPRIEEAVKTVAATRLERKRFLEERRVRGID